MKRTISVLLAIVVIAALTACSASKEKKPSVFEAIQESSVALMESSDGTGVYVWNMQDLASLDSLQIEKVSLKPAGKEEDWLYRITYDPKDIVSNSEEIIVSFHSEYIQIGTDFYTAKKGVNFEDILGWAETKYEYLVKEYGAK